MTLNLERCRVLFPDWYDELAEVEAEHKGWLQGVSVELADGRRVPVHFYDPVRLGQDLEEDAKWGRPCIAEPGLIVVPAVTREAIRQAVAYLSGTDYFDHLRDEGRMTPQRGEANRHANGVPTDTLGAA
jgi:hypothetical protein